MYHLHPFDVVAMNTYDTLKITFPVDLLGIGSQERNRLFDRRTVDGGEGKVTKWTLKSGAIRPIAGLSSLELHDSKAVLELSAKTLGTKYFGGISRTNLSEAIFASLPHQIDFKEDVIIDKANVMRCDVVQNLVCENIPFTLSELALYPTANHTERTPYVRGRIESVVWRSTRKSNTLRLTAYDKIKEASRKRDPTLWKALDIQRFESHIRIEANLRKHSDIRDLHGIIPGMAPYLTDVINSQKNVLGAVMDTFLRPELKPQTLHTTRNGLEGIKEEGYLSVFRRANWDWDVVRAYVLAGYSTTSNHSRLIKQVKALFDANNPNASNKIITEYDRVRDAINAI